MLVDEIKKINLKKNEKNQASLGEPCKPGLIFQTRNTLNCRLELKQEAQHLLN
jgi:hypothetical protein